MEHTSTFREQVDRVLAMLQADFDWDAYYEQEEGPGIEKCFRTCCILGEPEEDDSKNYYACGSAKVQDTQAGLYRMLYLLRPPHVDFSDMYKTCLFGFFSADKRFLTTVELFQYELGLYFYCPKEALGGNTSFVQAGSPGSDNGTHCTDPDGNAWFQMVAQAAQDKWEVYPGNDFTV